MSFPPSMPTGGWEPWNKHAAGKQCLEISRAHKGKSPISPRILMGSPAAQTTIARIREMRGMPPMEIPKAPGKGKKKVPVPLTVLAGSPAAQATVKLVREQRGMPPAEIPKPRGRGLKKVPIAMRIFAGSPAAQKAVKMIREMRGMPPLELPPERRPGKKIIDKVQIHEEAKASDDVFGIRPTVPRQSGKMKVPISARVLAGSPQAQVVIGKIMAMRGKPMLEIPKVKTDTGRRHYFAPHPRVIEMQERQQVQLTARTEQTLESGRSSTVPDSRPSLGRSSTDTRSAADRPRSAAGRPPSAAVGTRDRPSTAIDHDRPRTAGDRRSSIASSSVVSSTSYSRSETGRR